MPIYIIRTNLLLTFFEAWFTFSKTNYLICSHLIPCKTYILNCIYLLLEERKKLSTPTGGKDERDDRTPSMKDLDLDDDSDDDDMNDIFEKARRKYHLDVDD